MAKHNDACLFTLFFKEMFHHFHPYSLIRYIPSLTKKSARKNVTFIDAEECGMPVEFFHSNGFFSGCHWTP